MKSIVAMLAVIMVPAAVTVAADCQTTKGATYPNPHLNDFDVSGEREP